MWKNQVSVVFVLCSLAMMLNVRSAGTTEIAFISGKNTEWLDYLPAAALLVKATTSFCAVAMEDGCINVYSHNGRR